MSIFSSTLGRLYDRFGVVRVRIALALLVVLIGAGSVAALSDDEAPTAPEEVSQIVRVAPAGELAAFGRSVSVVGTVTAVDEAEVRSEISGSLTSVTVAIGDRVGAGAVLATFENASERAAVLQAEGAYEAALASASASDISAGASAEDVEDARIDAWNEYRSAYVIADDIARTTLDALFSDFNRQLLGLSEYVAERRAIGYDLDLWGERSREARPQDVSAALQEARTDTAELTAFIDTIYAHIVGVERRSSNSSVESVAATYKSELTTARTSLNTTDGALASARATLVSTQADFEQAQIAGTGGVVSSADAAVKQALGSLRAAQATLEKTVVRSPIDGVINSVYVKRGEFVSAASPIAMVVSEGALEVTAYLTEDDRNRIEIGSEVTFEDESTGVVTRIAPSIDRTTQKYEVKISPEDGSLEAGDVVRVTLSDEDAIALDDASPLYLPLSAVKLTAESAAVFSVEEGVLVAHVVELGDVRGTSVRITSGLSRDRSIVLDARGLAPGDTVRIVE